MSSGPSNGGRQAVTIPTYPDFDLAIIDDGDVRRFGTISHSQPASIIQNREAPKSAVDVTEGE